MVLLKHTFLLFVLTFVWLHQAALSQEKQISIDREGKIFIIDSEMRQKLEMFSDVQGFQEARLYQESDSAYILEISYQQAGQRMRRQQPMNVAQVKELRIQVSKLNSQIAPLTTIDQSGRGKFLYEVIGISFGYYGWTTPILLQPKDGRVVVGLYLLTVGGAYLYANIAAEDMEITNAMATGFQYGATRGIVHSLALFSLCAGSETKIRWAIPFGALGSVVEGAIVMSSIRENKTNLGTIDAQGAFEDYGIGLGVGLAYLFRSGDQFDASSSDLRLLGGMALVGSGLGYLAGGYCTSKSSYTSGGADILQTSEFLTTSLAFTLADLFGVKERKPLVTYSLIGAAAGLAIGHGLAGNRDFSEDAGTSVRLITSAGVIIGLGVAYIIAQQSADRTIYFSLATLGGISGFSIACLSAFNKLSAPSQSHSWNIHFDPIGLTSTLYAQTGKTVVVQSPAVRFEYRF